MPNPSARVPYRLPHVRMVAACGHSAILFLLLLFAAVQAIAGQVTLAWDPVIDSSVAGYNIYYGPATGSYLSRIDVGNTTLYTVTDLTEGATYRFAATAYDIAHAESGFSNDVIATVAYGAPVADFIASARLGAAPLAMNFTNTSTGTISGYAWSFGDGTTSNEASPSHVYVAVGAYTVALTVTGPGGSSTQTKTDYVVVSSRSGIPMRPPLSESE